MTKSEWHLLHLLEWIKQFPNKTEDDYYDDDHYIMMWDKSQQGPAFWASKPSNVIHSTFAF